MLAKIGNIFSSLFLVVLLTLAAIMAGPYLLGYQNLSVISASMEPTIPVGGMVTIDTDATPEDIAPGDVITFTIAGGEHLSTHRVMEVNPADQTFITKGDNNSNVDIAPVGFDRLEGKVVFSVKYLGHFIDLMQSSKGIFIIAGVLVFIVLFTLLPMLFQKDGKQAKAKNRKQFEVPEEQSA